MPAARERKRERERERERADRTRTIAGDFYRLLIAPINGDACLCSFDAGRRAIGSRRGEERTEREREREREREDARRSAAVRRSI
jgi:hypothetical protein